MCGDDEKQLTQQLIAAVRDLQSRLESKTNLMSLGIAREDLEKSMEHLLVNAENDNQIVPSPRQPDRAELKRLFEYAHEGKHIDF
jgi:alcohol dehydrogenase class IV